MKKIEIYTFTFIFLIISTYALESKKAVYDIHLNNNGKKKDFKINEIENNPIETKNFLQSSSEEKLNTNTQKESKIKEKASRGCGCAIPYGYGNCGLTCSGVVDGYCSGGRANHCGGYGYPHIGSGLYGYNGGCRNRGYIGNGYLGEHALDYGCRDGFYGHGIGNYGCGPLYARGCAHGRGHLVSNGCLRGKYISLRDAAALLACERDRKLARHNACNNYDRCNRADANSKYLDKDYKVCKALSNANACDNYCSDYGKDFRGRKCDSAYEAACDRDNSCLRQKRHQRLNTRKGKNEACCMNSNNLDKFCTDGNLMEEFDTLSHFKKCANGHKEKINGKDCTVKKRHDIHDCQDAHSLACHRNANHKATKGRRQRDKKDISDFHEHDLRNKNSRANKIDRKCYFEDDICKACKAASSRDNERKRQNSNGIVCEKNDKQLKKICDKNINSGCIDSNHCVNGAIASHANNHAVSNPIC